jgi:S1-C subfamily serine protease
MICVPAAPALGGASLSRIADRVSGSVVKVEALDAQNRVFSLGSGFFVGTDGDIVTCHHVLAGSAGARVETLDGRKGRVLEVLKDDPDLDLLIARTTLRDSVPLVLANSDRVRVGDDILSIGIEAESNRTLSVGRVRGVRGSEGVRLLEVTAPVMPGNSGGPVLNFSGEVIGVAAAFLPLKDLLCFAVPVNLLRALPPVRMGIASLPRSRTRLEATVRDETLLEVCLRPYEAAGPEQGRRGGGRQGAPAAPWTALKKADGRPFEAPGAVYFRNGRQVLCDRAWRDRNTVILLVHGRRIAVGYDIGEIDMERSFR